MWDLRSAILSDLVGADIKSDTADIIHSQRKELLKCRRQKYLHRRGRRPRRPLKIKDSSRQACWRDVVVFNLVVTL